MRSHSRIASILLAVAAVTWLSAPTANADTERVEGSSGSFASKLELGVFVGRHVFADDNELGVWDGNNADSLRNSLAVGLRLSYALVPLLSIEGEGLFMPTESRDSGSGALAFGYRLHGLLHFTAPENKLRPFVVLGFGGMSSTESDDNAIRTDADALVHTGLGLKYRVGDQWGVRADGRVLFPPSSEDNGITTDFEVLVGAYMSFGAAEKIVREMVPVDSDGDGLYDDDDKCPNEAEDKDGFEDEDGCPDLDNDGDGVPDTDDKCMNEAETVNGVDDEDGCPETDEDGDGLVGSADSCPTEPEDKDGFEDTDGCPDPDNDGDGIADADDKCMNEAETANGYEDADGCPDEVPATVAKFTGAIKGIKFKTGSAVLQAASYATLKKAAEVLNEYPDLRLEVQGHTDSKGDDDKNMALSQARADSVKKYLVKKGVDEGRIEAKGFGETVPVADNETKQGRAENRRVEYQPTN